MGVQFEESNFAPRDFNKQAPKLASWIIKKGWAKDVAGANMIQIVVAIVFFVLAAFFAFY